MKRFSIAGVVVSLSLSCLASIVLAADPDSVATCRVVWEYATPNAVPQAVALDPQRRSRMYVALKQGGLAILDTSQRRSPPKELARVTCDQFAGLHVMHVAAHDHYLYLALGDLFDSRGAPPGLAILDMERPERPRVVGVWKSDATLRGASSVLVEPGWAYLAAMKGGVYVLNVERPDRIEKVAVFEPDIHFPRRNPNSVQHPHVRGLAKQGDVLYVAYDAGCLRVLDLSDRRHPTEIGRYSNDKMAHKQQAFNQLALDRDVAYVTVDYAGLEVLDVRNPRQIRQLGWWNPWKAETLGNVWLNSPGHANQLAYDARRKRVWLSAGDSELQVLDVARRQTPRLVARYGEANDRQGAWGVTLDDDLAYVSYMPAVVPFRGSWAGVRALELPADSK